MLKLQPEQITLLSSPVLPGHSVDELSLLTQLKPSISYFPFLRVHFGLSMDPDESDVVHSDLVYSPIAVTIDFLMITPVLQFNTVVTGDIGKERLLTELKAAGSEGSMV